MPMCNSDCWRTTFASDEYNWEGGMYTASKTWLAPDYCFKTYQKNVNLSFKTLCMFGENTLPIEHFTVKILSTYLKLQQKLHWLLALYILIVSVSLWSWLAFLWVFFTQSLIQGPGTKDSSFSKLVLSFAKVSGF